MELIKYAVTFDIRLDGDDYQLLVRALETLATPPGHSHSESAGVLLKRLLYERKLAAETVYNSSERALAQRSHPHSTD